MFLMLALLTSLSTTGIVIAGGLAFIRNPQLRLNQFFFLLTLSLALWIPSNFFGSNVVQVVATPILVKLDFSFALFIVWSLLYFFTFIIQNNQSFIKRSKPFFVATLAANFILVVSIFAGQVIRVDLNSGSLVVHNGSLYPAYLVLLGFYILFSFTSFAIPYFGLNKLQKRTLNLILIGALIASLANILTNLVFPQIFQSRQTIEALNSVGYIGIVLFVICLYVSITTRKLFDIRLIIARSLVYILSLSILAVVYGLITYGLTNILSATSGYAVLKTIFSTALIILMVLSYSSVKRFFNKVTNRYFYRDAYDTQVFLDQLNSVLVTTLDLDMLLRHCIKVIESNLKAEFTNFYIRKTPYKESRVIGLPSKHIDVDSANELDKLASTIHAKVIVADELDEKTAELQELLTEYNVRVLVRLQDKVSNQKEDLGYLILGAKKSGNIYNKQDHRTLETISNELVIAIQNALRFEEIENFNITLQQKIDNATKQLRQTNDKLKELDESKDEFISMASHQLRTPLTSVKGYISMILDGDAGRVSKEQKDFLHQAFDSSQRMVYLIADLLNVSRLQTGKFVIENKPTNMADLIEGELKQVIETAKAKKLELTYAKPENFPTLMLDDTKIRQVVMNFVDNAIYYTPAGGHITVKLEDKGQSIECTVSDDGIGVPKAEQHHLFNKFYRAGNAQKARPDGTGLGLFMAKKVVAAQGGSIIFTSSEGKGSTFGFAFPKDKLKVPDNLQVGAPEEAKEPTSALK